MKNIKENPQLNYNSIRNFESVGATLIVSPETSPVAKELSLALFMRFREQNPDLEEKELGERFGFNIFTEPNLKTKEWVFIQRNPQEIFYSKGDGTK